MRTRHRLDPRTLLSVAKELRHSEEHNRAIMRKYAKEGIYSIANESKLMAGSLARWAEHFEGQAKTAAMAKRRGR